MLSGHISGEDQYPTCLYVLIEQGQPATAHCQVCGNGGCRTWKPYMGSGPRLPSRADLELAHPHLFKPETLFAASPAVTKEPQ